MLKFNAKQENSIHQHLPRIYLHNGTFSLCVKGDFFQILMCGRPHIYQFELIYVSYNWSYFKVQWYSSSQHFSHNER